MMNISGISGMNFSPISTNSLMRVSMPSTHISTLTTQCKFLHGQTQEMLKIMVLQHRVSYHEARDWIHLQDQSYLTYQSLLVHCKLLQSCCEQLQKAKEMGQADLMNITAATSSASSVHTNALPTLTATNVITRTPQPSVQPRDKPAMPVAA